MKTRGSFALLDSLVRNGTRHIFGYPGGAILPIYELVIFTKFHDDRTKNVDFLLMANF